MVNVIICSTSIDVVYGCLHCKGIWFIIIQNVTYLNRQLYMYNILL